MAVFIDTGAFMAYMNKKDIYHSAADGLVHRTNTNQPIMNYPLTGSGVVGALAVVAWEKN